MAQLPYLVLAVCLVLIFVKLILVAPKLPEQSGVLAWPREKVLASPENTAEFLKARLVYIADQLPQNYRDQTSGNQPTCEVLRQFARSDEFDRYNSVIRETRLNLRLTDQYTLTLLPDFHVAVKTSPKTEERIAKRQYWITKVIQKKKPKLVFAEGTLGEINWQTLYHGLQEEQRRRGDTTSTSMEGFKHFLKQQDTSLWITTFLDNPSVTVCGYDPDPLITVGTILVNIKPANRQKELQEIWEDTRILLSITYREQVIVAHCKREMQRRNLNSAYIVLGEKHTETFPAVCKEWNIKLNILAPPL